MWKNGAVPNTTSSPVSPIQSRYVWELNTTLPWLFIAPFEGPVVPDVYVRNATSSAARLTAPDRPALRCASISSTRSSVCGSRDRLAFAKGGGGGVSSRKSSSDVVIAITTSVPPTTSRATSSQSDSNVTSALAPE